MHPSLTQLRITEITEVRKTEDLSALLNALHLQSQQTSC